MGDNLSFDIQWEEMERELEESGYTKRDPKEVFGEQLKEFRLKRKMSIAQAAEKSGFSAGTISNYESGKTAPTIEDLQMLLFVYGVSLYEYFGIEKADYENDLNVFKRYGLSETFYRELVIENNFKAHNNIAHCINLIFECPLYASVLFEELTCFFSISYHEQVDRIALKLPLDASIRVLLEPVIHTLGSIFNATYPERQKEKILFLKGQHAARQAEVQAEIQAEVFRKAKLHEKR